MSTSETSEQHFNHRLIDKDLVVAGPSLQVEKLHRDRLSRKDLHEVVGGDTVLADEPLEDMKTFRCDDVDSTIFEMRGIGIGGIRNQVGVHKVLTDRFGHFSRHAERGRRSSGDYSILVFRIRRACGLGEFE